jgi:hypothetical protein
MIGRVLGIGVRVVGRAAGQHLTAHAQPASAAPQVHQAAPVAGSQVQDRNRATAQAAARTTIHAGQSLSQSLSRGAVTRGAGGFLRPFRRVGGILWLEITGAFFLIFVPVFVWRGVWPARASYLHGPDHWRFLVFTGLALVFLYLGVSSFWRASRK